MNENFGATNLKISVISVQNIQCYVSLAKSPFSLLLPDFNGGKSLHMYNR